MVIKWDEIMPAGQIERRASHKILAQIGMARACKTNNGRPRTQVRPQWLNAERTG